jgi:hypothetical protein
MMIGHRTTAPNHSDIVPATDLPSPGILDAVQPVKMLQDDDDNDGEEDPTPLGNGEGEYLTPYPCFG